MKKIVSTTLFCSIFMSIIASCAPTRVSRINVDQVIDLSGRWNDIDSRGVAKYMSANLMSGGWLEQFRLAHAEQAEASERYKKSKPVVIVGSILNKSHEHIEADTFIKDIENEIIEKGEIRLVANSSLREKLRHEKREQVGFAMPATQKHFGRELGADYMIFGTITSTVDTKGKDKLVCYQVDLELIHLETNEKVWMGDKKIKKYVGGKKIKKKYTDKLPAS